MCYWIRVSHEKLGTAFNYSCREAAAKTARQKTIEQWPSTKWLPISGPAIGESYHNKWLSGWNVLCSAGGATKPAATEATEGNWITDWIAVDLNTEQWKDSKKRRRKCCELQTVFRRNSLNVQPNRNQFWCTSLKILSTTRAIEQKRLQHKFGF